MKIILLVCAVAFATAAAVPAELSVSDDMAARVDAQAWRVDRLTKQYQVISDAADAALNAAKSAGDAANHLLKYHLKATDDWCPPNTERCGQSAQCISHLAFCDDVNDCKNQFDELPERCGLPVSVNTTWIGYPAYDRCTQRKPYEMIISITGAPASSAYKVDQLLKVQVDLFSMRGGVKQSASLFGDAYYCKGKQRLVIAPPEDDRLEIVGEFDGVYTDRFSGYIQHEMSGDRCAEFRFFKQ